MSLHLSKYIGSALGVASGGMITVSIGGLSEAFKGAVGGVIGPDGVIKSLEDSGVKVATFAANAGTAIIKNPVSLINPTAMVAVAAASGAKDVGIGGSVPDYINTITPESALSIEDANLRHTVLTGYAIAAVAGGGYALYATAGPLAGAEATIAGAPGVEAASSASASTAKESTMSLSKIMGYLGAAKTAASMAMPTPKPKASTTLQGQATTQQAGHGFFYEIMHMMFSRKIATA
jgi:hypothetical protein